VINPSDILKRYDKSFTNRPDLNRTRVSISSCIGVYSTSYFRMIQSSVAKQFVHIQIQYKIGTFYRFSGVYVQKMPENFHFLDWKSLDLNVLVPFAIAFVPVVTVLFWPSTQLHQSSSSVTRKVVCVETDLVETSVDTPMSFLKTSFTIAV
jgi:hypothetical protein